MLSDPCNMWIASMFLFFALIWPYYLSITLSDYQPHLSFISCVWIHFWHLHFMRMSKTSSMIKFWFKMWLLEPSKVAFHLSSSLSPALCSRLSTPHSISSPLKSQLLRTFSLLCDTYTKPRRTMRNSRQTAGKGGRGRGLRKKKQGCHGRKWWWGGLKQGLTVGNRRANDGIKRWTWWMEKC